MTKSDVSALKWKKLDDWSGLHASRTTEVGSYVTESDLKHFLNRLIDKISSQAGIASNDFEEIFKQVNDSFYALKEKMFEKSEGLAEFSSEITALKDTLLVPVINSSDLSDCFTMYMKLYKREKLVFLQKVAPNYQADTKNVSNCVELFNGLTLEEKSKLLNIMLSNI